MDRRRLTLTILAALAVVLAMTGFVDQHSDAYADRAFKRALVTFAVARTLNGVISVAQGTEVAVEPGGVGVNFGVGQILDPVNDLVERFSAVMLVATTSLGLQNILLEMTGWWGVTLALALAALLTIALLWWPGAPERWANFAVRALLVTLFVRFSVGVLIIGSNLVFDTFLAQEQAAAVQALEATSNEIEELNEESGTPAPAEETLLERFGSMLDQSLESLQVSDRLKRFKDSVSNATEHIINLIVIFLLQTVLLPLVFVWLLVEGLKAVAARATRL